MPSLVIGNTGAYVGEAMVGSRFEFVVSAIIAGIDSAQAEGTGWDARRSTIIPESAVVRTSDTVVTITLAADASYNITAQETITATVPSAALVSGGPLTASPTFTIDAAAAGGSVIASPLIYSVPLKSKLRGLITS